MTLSQFTNSDPLDDDPYDVAPGWPPVLWERCCCAFEPETAVIGWTFVQISVNVIAFAQSITTLTLAFAPLDDGQPEAWAVQSSFAVVFCVAGLLATKWRNKLVLLIYTSFLGIQTTLVFALGIWNFSSWSDAMAKGVTSAQTKVALSVLIWLAFLFINVHVILVLYYWTLSLDNDYHMNSHDSDGQIKPGADIPTNELLEVASPYPPTDTKTLTPIPCEKKRTKTQRPGLSPYAERETEGEEERQTLNGEEEEEGSIPRPLRESRASSTSPFDTLQKSEVAETIHGGTV